MFEGEEKYFDKDNPEDDLQAALTDPDGSTRLLDSLSDLGFGIVEMENRWDELQKKIEKAERRRSKTAEDEPASTDPKKDEDKTLSDYVAEQKRLEKSLEQAKARQDRENRVLNEYYERNEKAGKTLEKLIPIFEKPLVQDKLKEKLDKLLEGKSREELYFLHSETIKRDKSLPSRQPMLDAIDDKIKKHENINDIKKRDQQEKENKGGGVPGPTRQSEKEEDEEDLMSFYLSNRRSAQKVEGPELLNSWLKRTKVVEDSSSTLKDFLNYKACVNELIARYRIAERGSLE